MDNVPEFIAKKTESQGQKNEIALHYIQREKYAQNSLERFN
jgi:hypothetical protein